MQVLETLAAHPRVVGIGETGLDYFRDLAPRERQAAAFRAQVRLAKELGRPLVVHTRDAHVDNLRLLGQEATGLPAVILHCFQGDHAVAHEAWARGYYTSLAGPLTYPSANGLRQLAAEAPKDRILIETDAPYLPPVPHRGRRNEPAFLRLVAEALAAAWGWSPERVGQLTARNACRAFGLPDPGGQA